MELKSDAPIRDVTEIGAGDFILVDKDWYKVRSNTAEGRDHPGKSWAVTTQEGHTYTAWSINRYAKAEDFA
jgi:hypothetical protein